jgi:hypothetical protein
MLIMKSGSRPSASLGVDAPAVADLMLVDVLVDQIAITLVGAVSVGVE